MIHNQSQQLVEEGEVDLVVEFLELGLHEHDGLALAHVPHVGEVVDPLAPLIHEQWGWLGVTGLDPGGEEPAFVGLIPEVLVEVGVSDLLYRLDVVDRDQVRVEVHEFNAHLLEGAVA